MVVTFEESLKCNDEVSPPRLPTHKSIHNMFSTLARTGEQELCYKVIDNILHIPEDVNVVHPTNLPSRERFTTVDFGCNPKLKRIGKQCFSNNKDLTTITIPASVKTIDEEAFCLCSSLKEVIFEENSNLEEIGKSAFRGCKLISVVIPSSVKAINGCAFWECADLQSVTFEKPTSLEKISGALFLYCTSLREFTVPSSVESIGKHAFRNCSSLTSLTIEEGSKLEFIGQRAISETAIKTFKVPKSVKKVGFKAFGTCKHLKSIEFENRQTKMRGHREVLREGSFHLMEAILDTNDFAETMKLSDLSVDEIDDFARLIVQSEGLQNFFNDKFCSALTVFSYFLELYVNVAIIVLYMFICDDFISPVQQNLNMTYWILLSLLLFCLLREIFQFYKEGFHYFDIWNIIILLKLFMIFSSVQFIRNMINQNENQVPEINQYAILITGCIAIIDFIIFLRISNRSFARFVDGLVQIFSILGPFLMVSVLLLLAFAFMYHTKRGFETKSTPTGSHNSQFTSLGTSLLTTLLFLTVDADTTFSSPLDLLYGFIITVVLLNGVIIAVVGVEWSRGEQSIQHTFWKYRLYYLIDPFVSFINANCTPVRDFFETLNQFQNKDFFDIIRWYEDPFDKFDKQFDEEFETYKQLSHKCPELTLESQDPSNPAATIDFGGREEIKFMIEDRTDLEKNLKGLRSWQRDIYWMVKGKFKLVEVLKLGIQLVLHILCVILGPLTFGLLWHNRIRLAVFSQDINAKEDEDFEHRLHNKMVNLHHKILNLEAKLDALKVHPIPSPSMKFR